MRTPTPATHSQDARRALLRRTWQPPFDSLEVDYSTSDLQVKLTASGETLLQGTWGWEITADGDFLTACGGWEEVCWHTDSRLDYLEVELPLSGGGWLQRQMVLARNDQFLYLAEAIIGPKDDGVPSPAREIRLASRLPMVAGAIFEPAFETREGMLDQGRGSRKKRFARILPPAFPEWRVEHSTGEIASAGNCLVVTAAAEGQGLYMPLWIDLSADRLRRECTWRRLTVGENLEVQPRDVAVGYRVQVGNEQWLIYKSLATKRSRTVLGQNYANDFVLCRFLADGTTEDLVEIE